MHFLTRDLKLAFRQVITKPGFSATVILTLALGIGAASAVFGIVYGMVLRPFPYPEPESLLRLSTFPQKNPGNEYGVSLADYEDIARGLSTVSSLGAYLSQRVNLVVDGRGTPLELTLVTPGLFPTLGIAPQAGRNFLPEEDRPGGDTFKAILSHELWSTRYGQDPNLLGKVIRTASASYTVVGIMPPGFTFPARTDIWTPVQAEFNIRKLPRPNERAFRSYSVLARLKPGATQASLAGELDRISSEIRAKFATENGEVAHRMETLREAETKRLRPYLFLLSAAVALLLLTCCVNVTNLMLARGAARQRTITVLSALGASRLRIASGLLTEALVLGLLGGSLGIGLAVFLVRALPGLIPEQLPGWMSFEIDLTVLAFAFGVSILSAVLSALAPALTQTKVHLADALKEGAKGSSGRSGTLRSVLVISEVGLAVLLLTGSGLLVRSFQKLLAVDYGFAPEHIVAVSTSPYRTGTNEERIEKVCRYYEEVTRRLRQLPGVIAVGGTDNFPYTRQLSERKSLNVEAKGEGMEVRAIRAPANFVDVTPGYFETMGIPLLAGRDFRETDDRQAPWVITLSERAAKALFGDRDPIGQQVRAGTPGHFDPYATVVGVVGNVKYRAQEDNRTLEFYYPYRQYGLTNAYIAVRAQGDPKELEAAIRATVASIDPETAVNAVQTMTGLIENSLWQQRLWGLLLLGFAGAALLLAVIGLYGMMSYNVSLRTREIGIRMAIGATQANVLREVGRDGLRLVGMGIACGLAASFFAAPYLDSLIFGVAATDPVILIGVLLLVTITGLLACLAPAVRASLVDPILALRNE